MVVSSCSSTIYKYIELIHFGVVDCNQAALLRTGILVAVSGILLF